MKSLLYIHGFNSSAKGIKGQQLKDIMLDLGLIGRFRAPDLLVSPAQAIEQLEKLIVELETPTLVGSSLGGYYATYLANKFKLKALLINPVVLPHKLLGKQFDEQQDWQNEQSWTVELITKMVKEAYDCEQSFIDDYIKELAALEIAPPTDKKRYKVWLKTGDEVLDYRFAKQWYKDCDLTIDQGGDHSFDDFGERLPAILDWAGLTNKE